MSVKGTERTINGQRIVRLRAVGRRIGPVRMTLYTLSDPFSRKHLIPAQVLKTQAELIANRNGWRVLG